VRLSVIPEGEFCLYEAHRRLPQGGIRIRESGIFLRESGFHLPETVARIPEGG
jgi:hypothetical protein